MGYLNKLRRGGIANLLAGAAKARRDGEYRFARMALQWARDDRGWLSRDGWKLP